jgi:AraC family L-rhamnose operon regulatory protein RhaS
LARTFLPEHTNCGLEICYSYRGNFSWNIEDRKVAMKTEEMTITLPWQRHSAEESFLEIGELGWIIIEPEEFSPDAKLRLGSWSSLPAAIVDELDRELRKEVPAYVGECRYLRHLFSELERELRLQDVGVAWRVNHIVDDILLALLRALRSTTKGEALSELNKLNELSELKDSFTELVLSDLAYGWTVEEMAERLHLSRSVLSEKLRAETGYSPMELLNRLRIEKARTLLRSSGENITSIALECGFSSSQYFASVFKKMEGVSPREYRTLQSAAACEPIEKI